MRQRVGGHLVISLDFELLWGIFDVVEASQKAEYFRNTRNVIPKILQLFEEYEIHCTWAVVGMLYHRNWEAWNRNFPAQLPDYHREELSPYTFGKNAMPAWEEFCFAPELISAIKHTPYQEIGTHTYSHYYCQEEGQSVGDFKADLEKAVELAEDTGIPLRSLVFPRNQYKKEYLQVCADLGIRTVRTNPDTWYWKNPASEALLTKIFRTGDAYNLLAKKKVVPLSNLLEQKGTPLLQKAGRFLRPYEKNKLLQQLKMKRIRSEMSSAAKEGKIYHLWWHPHNFGENTKENLRSLEELLKVYKECKQKFDFRSATMGEIEEMKTQWTK